MLSRRELLARAGAGFGALAFRGLAAADAHFPARAKRVIFLFMHGGPSSVDSFDYKPLLLRDTGKPLPFAKPRVVFAQTGNLLRSPWDFKRHGASGLWCSELFPNLARHADKLCVVKSMHGSNPAHGGACLKIHTGSDTFVRPSLGAWVSYGLGSENRNLPSFLTINPSTDQGGAQTYGAGFLPAVHQGTRLEKDGALLDAKNPELGPAVQRAQIDLLRELRERRPSDAGADARLESFELAFRMQATALGVMDLSNESAATKAMYGIGRKPTDAFGRQCLLTRRLAEAGVRFIQVTHGGWDSHRTLRKLHEQRAGEVDGPISALLQDLDNRGLLEDTLVIWGGEFGRTPVVEL
ncbi:MAG TPA: DUF1501 domain-containing protein, partial [Planctomycetota bacterium]